jgi:hypothetical protein
VPGLGKPWQLPAVADVVDALACATRGYGIGDRLYVQGTEPFLWSVATAAAIVGFGPGQLQLTRRQPAPPGVVHPLPRLTEQVTTNVVPCAGCGRHLLVRDHFSRRLGAFMGVMVDAEAPGEIPAIEEVFA